MERYEVRLRDRHQITLPDAIVTAAGIETGDKLVLERLDSEPPAFVLRPVLKSYAGLLRGVYGDSPDERRAYVQGEAASWDDPS